MAVAFGGGGYERDVYLELGTAAWLGLAAVAVLRPAELGALASARVLRVLGLLGALGAISVLSMIWSDSAERSALEALRVIGLVGVLALGVMIARRDQGQLILTGLAAGIVVVAGAALGSRVLFDLFPANETAEFLPDFQNRLNYPVGYWNALAALLGMGLPLILHLAATSRSAPVATLSCAAAPMVGLSQFLTLSRGGILAAIAGLGVVFVLSPARSRLAIATTGSLLITAMLAILASTQSDLFDGLTTPPAETQGVELLLATLSAMVLATIVLPRAMDHGAPALRAAAARLRARVPLPPKGRIAIVGGGAAVIVALALIVSGGGAWIVDEFEAAEAEGNTAGAKRLTSLNSSTRTEYWGSAIDAGAEHPLLGIGPGTWEFWWAENGEIGPFARDAHSLYLEAFAELGITGLLLVVALIALIVYAAVLATRREADERRRSTYAALSGTVVAFAVAAAVDWAWEATVLPMVFVLAAAPLLLAHEPERSAVGNRARATFLVVAVLVLAALGTTLRSELQITSSQDAAARDDLTSALNRAESATWLRDYAATPLLQKALVEEALGRYDDALESAGSAAEKEPTNWRHQLLISRIQEARGEMEGARKAFDRGQELNPRSPVFAESNRP